MSCKRVRIHRIHRIFKLMCDMFAVRDVEYNKLICKAGGYFVIVKNGVIRVDNDFMVFRNIYFINCSKEGKPIGSNITFTICKDKFVKNVYAEESYSTKNLKIIETKEFDEYYNKIKQVFKYDSTVAKMFDEWYKTFYEIKK